jgi:predicted phage terminase large subunit-like protein
MSWSPERYLQQLDTLLDGELKQLLSIKEGRVLLTKNNPLLFALVYLPHHLRAEETGNKISMSKFHLDLYREAINWPTPAQQPKQYRDAYVCPRGSGKTTLLFTILPMWLACHNHKKYISAFSNTAGQAEAHLSTFTRELATNELIRNDYSELCTPRKRNGKSESDRVDQYIAESGFAFSAKGMDSASLGQKIGNRRPDMILLDEIEPAESDYSPALVKKRFDTLTSSIFNLNINARVVLTGTVTMPGSIIHQIVESAEWVDIENIKLHHYLPVITNSAGCQESMWPERWSLEWLKQEEQRNPRMYMKDYLNKPLSSDGTFWRPEDIQYGQLEYNTAAILSIDPAVTTSDKSDYTAFAIVKAAPRQKQYEVCYARQLKLTGKDIRAHVIDLIRQYPFIKAILIETNQGGQLWREILSDLPVKVATVHHSVKKETRAAMALNEYQSGRVLHSERLTELEEQLCSFPNVIHDDLVDAVSTAIITIKKQYKL